MLPSGTNWLQATSRDIVILVTDLRPDDQDSPGDGGKIGRALRDIVERGDRAVGLVGVRSRFFGPVYDLPNGTTSDPLDGMQAFFLIIIGPPPVVNRLQGQLVANLVASPSEPDARSASYHAEIFTRHNRQMMAEGHWVGVAQAGRNQKVLPGATALDADSGRQRRPPLNGGAAGV